MTTTTTALRCKHCGETIEPTGSSVEDSRGRVRVLHRHTTSGLAACDPHAYRRGAPTDYVGTFAEPKVGR